MKTVPFLEYVRGTLTLKRIAPIPNPEIKTDEEFTQRIFQLADFYNKPFRPEMITELFEGFEEIDMKHINTLRIFANRYGGIWFSVLYINNKKTAPYDYYVNGKRFYLFTGITLDEFILNCSKELELTWKPGIVKEYFA